MQRLLATAKGSFFYVACRKSDTAQLFPLLPYRYDSREAWFLCSLLLPVRSCYCPRSQYGGITFILCFVGRGLCSRRFRPVMFGFRQEQSPCPTRSVCTAPVKAPSPQTQSPCWGSPAHRRVPPRCFAGTAHIFAPRRPPPASPRRRGSRGCRCSTPHSGPRRFG